MDAGLQDTANFVDTGLGSGGALNGRSDLGGDPGTRFNITLSGAGWKDITIGDGFDLPTNNAGLVAATGNSGNLSAYGGYTMTIYNPGSDAFMVALYMNTGWTDAPWNHTDRYYQNDNGSVTWVGAGQTVTLTLDFSNAALWNGSGYTTGQIVQNLAYVTNIGLKIGSAFGTGEVQSGVAFDVDIIAHANVLELNVQAPSVYVKFGENVITDMDVKHLLQNVNACQAMLGYSSTYFLNPVGGAVTVVPGGGIWDQVIYDSWSPGPGTPGQIDTAIGVNANGAIGTNADGTVAIITLVADNTEGVTQIVFRADASPDPGLTASTFLSDMSANPVWPTKYNSQIIVIDNTAPTISIVSAKQVGVELLISLGSTTNAVQGLVNIQVTASDALAGLAGPPTVTVVDSLLAPLAVAYVNENPIGTFNYTATVTAATANGIATITANATDKSGNTSANVADTFNINKNQITGNVTMDTFSPAGYAFIRTVDFVATDALGNVLKSWPAVPVPFNNPPAQVPPEVASGPYTLNDVPGGIVNLSAKTAWSLRKRNLGIVLVGGQAVCNFMLKGGDINASNSINVLDYSLLKVNWGLPGAADINGDGAAQLLDYSIMRNYWFNTGDPQ
jgi:hypothetical protein